MTFDDGPHPKLTLKLLDLFKERGIKATFFVIGKISPSFPRSPNASSMKAMKSPTTARANHS